MPFEVRAVQELGRVGVAALEKVELTAAQGAATLERPVQQSEADPPGADWMIPVPAQAAKFGR